MHEKNNKKMDSFMTLKKYAHYTRQSQSWLSNLVISSFKYLIRNMWRNAQSIIKRLPKLKYMYLYRIFNYSIFNIFRNWIFNILSDRQRMHYLIFSDMEYQILCIFRITDLTKYWAALLDLVCRI